MYLCNCSNCTCVYVWREKEYDILKWPDQKQIANLENSHNKVASGFKFTRVVKDLSTAIAI